MAKLTKKNLISAYVKARKELKTRKALTREQFKHHTSIGRTHWEGLFGSYTAFIKEAEDAFLAALPEAQRALLSERSKRFEEEASQDDCISDLRLVQEKDPDKFITRTFYRIHGKYSDSTWNRYFGTFLEFRRQAGLELNRNQHALETGIAKHASRDLYRKFFREEVLPYYKKYQKKSKPSKIKTIMVGSDIHDIEVHEFTLSLFIESCKLKQPDVIVLNGDIFDCYEFSRYTQDPRQIKIKERFDFVHERIFGPLRDACPNAQIDFILGNHEIRILKILADKSPNLRVLLSDVMNLTFADVFGVDKFQINIVSKLDLAAFSKKDMNNEMKQNYQVYFDSFAATHEPDERIRRSISGTNGHHHAASFTTEANLDRGPVTWVQTPAMHVRDAEYLSRLTAWNTGFLEVIVNTHTRQVIQKIHQTHDDWAVIDGVFYERKEV